MLKSKDQTAMLTAAVSLHFSEPVKVERMDHSHIEINKYAAKEAWANIKSVVRDHSNKETTHSPLQGQLKLYTQTQAVSCEFFFFSVEIWYRINPKTKEYLEVCRADEIYMFM